MRHEDKMRQLRAMHENLLARIAELEGANTPDSTDKGKLERTYETLRGYAFVLKKL
ncbi:MAG: hypothetical protein ACREBH_00410 [Candidatus Micrarchaeaceae archaeon]